MSILIKNGHIFTAVDSYVADILVDEGKIRTIGIELAAQANKTVDATGKYVIPGGIDPHTHLDFPLGGTVSSDDFRTMQWPTGILWVRSIGLATNSPGTFESFMERAISAILGA